MVRVEKDLQPIYGSVMGELVNKFVDHSVNANSTTRKFKFRVNRVQENEVVSIEIC